MKNSFFKIISILGLGSVLLTSCGPKDNPPLVYFPDMYFPVAYDPLAKTDIAYSKHENEIPLFVKNEGASGLGPVTGTVAQNNDFVVEANNDLVQTPDEYNGGYDEAKTLTVSPLNAKNKAKDLARGKILFEHTCSACHGVNGDGQGPIVLSGAYSGVPKYADREITVGSVHYVMMHGRNAMGSYAGMLNIGDRWRVAMYVMNAFKSQPSATATAPMAATPATPMAASAPAATATTETTKK
ncbi:c-type cytochrome [Halpernia frigidisoli]|uniref:Cytochrome c, mono-and diheme variants n=1 Tax=Halpernia frigidisoli TaxID=1125876 RepID=A0A1I3GUN9_9FLAO|nr:cytochrome c [Halpernia frigidisoli]SFI27123.1 Cytochrome c, mono-and diheme variants [Halpernia frigidisoli]